MTAAEAQAENGVADEIDRLEQTLGVIFESYRQRLKQRAADIHPTLQPSGYRTLATLVWLGPSGATRIAETLGYDKSVLSRHLHQLETLGLVTREHAPDDRRAVIISATASAIQRVRSLSDNDRDEFHARLTAWGRRDLEELIRLLTKLGEPADAQSTVRGAAGG